MTFSTQTILIVEDEPADVEFLRRAFAKAYIPNPVHSVANGEEAIAYLKGQGRYADRKAFPFPRVVITDLKMPQMDGLQLLRWIQLNPAFGVVPTIVLTSSTSQADVDAAFHAGASAYFVKPVDFKELEQIARIITDYWKTSLLPSRTSARNA
jgi:CheY-like chemotaxis protein